MRAYFRSIAKHVVFVLVVAILSTGMAMAAYICPQLPEPMLSMEMPDGVPCAEMDKDQPVLCAQAQAGEDLALELATTLSATVPEHGFMLPAPILHIPPVIAHTTSDALSPPGSLPPYLNTGRLRI